MSAVEDISAFLAANNKGIEANNLFCYQWTVKTPDNAILVTQTGGGTKPKRFLGIRDTINEASISILIRNTNIFTAKTKAQEIFDLLDNNESNKVPGYFQVTCDQSEPNFIDVEETVSGSGLYRYYFSVNVKAKFVKS